MTMVIKKLSIATFLLFSMMSAFAKPGNSWEIEATEQIVRQVQWAEASEARRDDIPMSRNFDRREMREPREVRQYEEPRGGRDAGNYGQSADDASKRSGKMTPEERRELRRQIDEAGRNIYSPKR